MSIRRSPCATKTKNRSGIVRLSDNRDHAFYDLRSAITDTTMRITRRSAAYTSDTSHSDAKTCARRGYSHTTTTRPRAMYRSRSMRTTLRGVWPWPKRSPAKRVSCRNAPFPNWDPLKAIRYTAGPGWGGIADVDDSVFFDAINNVSITNNNDGLIVRRDGNSSLVTYAYQNSLGWGTEQNLYTSPEVLFNPAVAVNLSGVGVIAWLERAGTNYQVRARLIN